MWLIFKDRTRPGVTSMPDEIYGTSDVLDQALKGSLAKPGHPGASFNFKLGPFHQDQAVNVNLQNLRVNAEVSCIQVGQNKPEA